jgi:hypothetical protein
MIAINQTPVQNHINLVIAIWWNYFLTWIDNDFERWDGIVNVWGDDAVKLELSNIGTDKSNQIIKYIQSK